MKAKAIALTELSILYAPIRFSLIFFITVFKLGVEIFKSNDEKCFYTLDLIFENQHLLKNRMLENFFLIFGIIFFIS